MKKLPKFLVRPRDYHIWELDESNNCYRSWSCRDVTYSDGTRPNAQKTFTLELLLECDFFPIEESEVDFYDKKHSEYLTYSSWLCRSDGHAYVNGFPTTEYYFPCGDMREFGEIWIETTDQYTKTIKLNLKNHGFVIGTETLEQMEEIVNSSKFTYKTLGESVQYKKSSKNMENIKLYTNSILKQIEDLKFKIIGLEDLPDGELDVDTLSDIDEHLERCLNNWYY